MTRLLHILPPEDPYKKAMWQDLVEAGSLSSFELLSVNVRRSDEPRDFTSRFVDAVRRSRPTAVIWEHPGQLETKLLVGLLRSEFPDAKLGYREEDAYGLLRKRLPRGARQLARGADVTYSVVGPPASALYRLWGARRCRWYPNTASRRMFPRHAWSPDTASDRVVMVGNRVEGLPGCEQRERLARALGATFGSRFVLVGSGWEGFPGSVGVWPAQEVPARLRQARVSVGWNHFDRFPKYFSGRVVMSLMSGVPTVSNRQPGYEGIFRHGREILLADSVAEAVDLAQEWAEKDDEELRELSRQGQDLAYSTLAMEVIFPQMLKDLERM